MIANAAQFQNPADPLNTSQGGSVPQRFGEPASAPHVERVLAEIDSLPTLPAVATRLLTLTASDETETKEVIDVIRTDPALTSKVLALCGTAEKGVRGQTLTIDRAVVLLGFTTVRNAVLSLKVFEALPSQPSESSRGEGPAPQEFHFDRTGFWLHTLAVAQLAQRIVEVHPNERRITPDQAFVGGLLHDVGKIALHLVLPKSYNRVLELAELNQGDIAEFERRIAGLDHHVAGKRLAEFWGLPEVLRDCIWMHGMPFEAIPEVDHRRLVGLITLADLLARRLHIGFSGNYRLQHPRVQGQDPANELIEALGFQPERVERATRRILTDVQEMANALGLDETPTNEAYIRCVERANAELGHVNASLERRVRKAQRQSIVLDAISNFHQDLAKANDVSATLAAVALSARRTFGAGFYATVEPVAGIKSQQNPYGTEWVLTRYRDDGDPAANRTLAPPPDRLGLSEVLSRSTSASQQARMLSWLSPQLEDHVDTHELGMISLATNDGPGALLLHNREEIVGLFSDDHLDTLTLAWSVAVSNMMRRQASNQTSEQLASSTAELARARADIAEAEALVRLGEIAKGAAHEMNNPLTIIAGRAEMLVRKLTPETQEHGAATKVQQAAHRLSELITALHLFSEEPQPKRESFNPLDLIKDVIENLKKSLAQRGESVKVTQSLPAVLPKVKADREHVRTALIELIRNAVQSDPKRKIEVIAAVDDHNGTLRVTVTDDGIGMDEHTLSHACDPFFSNKEAGRNVGMGLPRAKRLIEANGGLLHLRSQRGSGTQAAIMIPLDGG